MTGPRADLRADHLRTPWARRWWAANGRPGFWFLASIVFAGNGLFSAWQHLWWLSIMQLATATLAFRAAILTVQRVPEGIVLGRDGPWEGTPQDRDRRANEIH
jgi:hypothetical protein